MFFPLVCAAGCADPELCVRWPPPELDPGDDPLAAPAPGELAPRAAAPLEAAERAADPSTEPATCIGFVDVAVGGLGVDGALGFGVGDPFGSFGAARGAGSFGAGTGGTGVLAGRDTVGTRTVGVETLGVGTVGSPATATPVTAPAIRTAESAAAVLMSG